MRFHKELNSKWQRRNAKKLDGKITIEVTNFSHTQINTKNYWKKNVLFVDILRKAHQHDPNSIIVILSYMGNWSHINFLFRIDNRYMKNEFKNCINQTKKSKYSHQLDLASIANKQNMNH